MMLSILLILLKWTFVCVVILLLIGIIYERISRWRLEQGLRGNMASIPIDKKRLYYRKQGTGNCTVVFVSGMGSSHQIWHRVQQALSKSCVTLSYDRSGILWSDATDGPITNEQVSAELAELLHQTNCPQPYVLVAHSMAGVYLRPFIMAQAKAIAGITFIEAANPRQIALAAPALLAFLKPPPHWMIRFAVETSLYRLLYSIIPFSPEISKDDPFQQQEKDFFYRSVSTVLHELDQTESNFAAAERYPSFGTIPLTLIVGTSPLRYQRIKNEAVKEMYVTWLSETQAELLHLSTSSKLIEAPNSAHLVQISDAALVVAAIEELVMLPKS